MVATDVRLLLQLPPLALLLSSDVAFTHMDVIPAIGPGSEFTVSVVVSKQPVAMR
jgi:hypothetical protein